MITGFAVGAVLIVAPIVILAVWGDNAGIQAAKASLYIAVFAGVLAVAFSTAYAIRSRGIARFPPAKAVCPRNRPTRSISREKYIFDAIIPTAPGIAARKKSRDGFVSRKNDCSELMMIPFKTIELTP